MKARVIRAAMLTPATALYALCFVAPVIVAVRLSLFKSNYITSTFVGFANYVKMFSDYYFIKSFGNAFILVLFIVPPLLFLAYHIAAHIADFSSRTQSALRFIFFIPGLASGIIMALIWRWILHIDGLINQLLMLAGLQPVLWLINAWPARVSVALIQVITVVGGNVLLLSAIICGLPAELRDAALIDGCNARKYRKYIIRPYLLRTILLIALLNIIGVMQIWETSYVLLPAGGPEGSTASPVYEIFLTAFMYRHQGYAAAKGVVLAVVIATMIAAKQRIETWAKQ